MRLARVALYVSYQLIVGLSARDVPAIALNALGHDGILPVGSLDSW
jgi:hypothetical protein